MTIKQVWQKIFECMEQSEEDRYKALDATTVEDKFFWYKSSMRWLTMADLWANQLSY